VVNRIFALILLIILSPLFLIALEILNVPYIWGGNNPSTGLDCSGAVQHILRRAGVLKDQKDRTAQELFNYLKIHYKNSTAPNEFYSGSVLFFGTSPESITHVEIAVSHDMMIGASGGGKWCDTPDKAKSKDARFKFSPISNRKDLVAWVRPEINI
jgi:cell wall-associated NlpC family hydrolase